MKEQLHEIDKAAGLCIRTLRTQLGMSQTDLGERIGVTFQQIQKYERGMNRVSIGKLVAFCQIFDISYAEFFALMEKGEFATDKKNGKNKAELEDVRRFHKIPPAIRRKVLVFMEAIGCGR